MNKNIIAFSDSYKLGHYLMLPEGTQRNYSYFEARKGAKYDKTLFYGLQYFLKEYLEGAVVSQADIDEMKVLSAIHMSSNELFNINGWQYILDVHDGRLPVHIKAVPEGTLVDVGNVLATVEVTDDNCAWLTNYIEGLLSQVWYPSTVATLSHEIKETFKYFKSVSSDDMNVDFLLQDFGFRGASSPEAAAIGGSAHLINFKGTDTVPALLFAKKYYKAELNTLAFSVPACYDDKTEILTNKGFKLFKDLEESDLVGQFHENFNISFVKPNKYYECDYNGKMVYFSKPSYRYVDMVVTPNHKMVYKKENGNVALFEARDEITYCSSRNVIVAGNGTGNKVELTDLEKLKIAFQADGSYPVRKDSYNGARTGCFPIRFSLKKERKAIRLTELLERLELEYTKEKYENGYYSFWVKVPEKMQKDFSWVVLEEISHEWAKAFVQELQFWDGSLAKNHISYSSINRSCVEIAQVIGILAGYKTQLLSYTDKRTDYKRKEIFSITFTLNKNSVGGEKIQKSLVDYTGKVYCVSVPTKMLVVRRNDVVSISGNTEHSVMTALGREGEFEIVQDLLGKFPTGILSVVADSYDYKKHVEKLCTTFKEQILARDGVYVIRPDSCSEDLPTPAEVVLWTFNKLAEHFGFKFNSKGYKVLATDKIKILYGDGLNQDKINDILTALTENFISIDIIACLGMGGGLLHSGVQRDTQRFAFKLCAQERNGIWYDVYKDPAGAKKGDSKSSKRGRMKLIKESGKFLTVPITDEREDILQTVFLNGKVVKEYTFDEVRENSNKG